MKKCVMILKMMDKQEPEQRAPEDQRLIDEHLRGCASCRERQRSMRLASHVMQSWEIPEISPTFSKDLMSLIDALPQKVSWTEYWGQSRWFSVLAGAAFAMSVVLMLGGLALPVQPRPQESLIKQRFTLIQGPSLKPDEVSIAARALGLEIE